MRIAAIVQMAIAVLLAGCSSQSAIVEPTESAIEARMDMLRTTAVTYATQYAFWKESQTLQQVLEQQASTLDRVFIFRPLMLKDNVMPPILQESRGNMRKDNSNAVRLSDRYIEIIKPAQIVTAAPTWRDYLLLTAVKPEEPAVQLYPRNKAERAAWNAGLIQGWRAGVWQARAILSESLGRLTRDVKGMILYRKLLAKGMITPTLTAKANLGITGDDRAIHLNDQIVRITAPSKLAKSQQWSAAPVVENKVASGGYRQEALPKAQQHKTAEETTAAPAAAQYPMLPKPIWSDEAVIQWAEEAAKKLFTYNYINHKKQFESMAKLFKPGRWDNFSRSRAKTTQDKINRQGVINAVLRTTPTLIDQTVIDGEYHWIIAIPLMVIEQYANNQAQYHQATLQFSLVQSGYDKAKVADQLLLKNDDRDIAIFIEQAQVYWTERQKDAQ